MIKRGRPKKYLILAIILSLVCLTYYLVLYNKAYHVEDLDLTRRNTVIAYIERELQETLKQEKGSGCEIPKLDPFAREVTVFDKSLPKVRCDGQNWVRCHLSQCSVTKEITKSIKDIVCVYEDILYDTDFKYHYGSTVEVHGDQPYVLKASDHAKVQCTGTDTDGTVSRWRGHVTGFRLSSKPNRTRNSTKNNYNILILGFDSTSKNGFIRRMPKSYRVLLEELDAVLLNGYNIVGDGTPAALFPILTGKTELEHPDVRRTQRNDGTLDSFPFLFYTLKDKGFRTLYFEDMPGIGTFQYRFNGFKKQPADHYLRSFFMEESKKRTSKNVYCVGDTPSYKLMLDLTKQFFELDSKKYAFTFIADITHDDFNMISTADDEVVDFFTDWKRSGRMKDTAVFFMGDHGPRYAHVRNTFQGKLEERLPLMAIVLPEDLVASNPEALTALKNNVNVLTTPHDIYATVLDILDMREYWNDYRVPGADLPRGNTLLSPIPTNRSCSEAGIESHWCSCLKWQKLSIDDDISKKVAEEFVAFVNELTESHRSCVPRYVISIEWVLRQEANAKLMAFKTAKDNDGYIGQFNSHTKQSRINYQIKLTVGPANGVYEASAIYFVKEDRYMFNVRDISRISAYGHEPDCISDIEPGLNKYCYCKNTV